MMQQRGGPLSSPVNAGDLRPSLSLPVLTSFSGGTGNELDIQQLRNDYSFRLSPTNRRKRAVTGASSSGLPSPMGSPMSLRCRSTTGFSSTGFSSPSSSRSKSLWPSPSLYHGHRAEQFFRTSATRHVLSDCGLLTLPRANAFHKRAIFEDEDDEEMADPGRPKLLPLEEQTSEILEKILPVAEEEEDLYSGSGSDSARSRSRLSSRQSRLSRQRSNHSSHRSKSPARAKTPGSKRGNSVCTLERPELLEFRMKVLHKLTALQGTWDHYVRAKGNKHKEVQRVDFMRFMNEHFRSLTEEEHESVFTFLDAEGSGAVSSDEFRAACDATLQIEEINDLRVRWVALGYRSMHQVLFEMEFATRKGRKWEPFDLTRRLELAQFGAVLWWVGIEREVEWKRIFEILTQYTHCSTVSLAELRAALVAIGPPMVLEELRTHILAKYGTMAEAFSILGHDDESELTMEEFIDFCGTAMHITPHDARKAFRLIDIDDSKGIDAVELIGSLLLAEPGLLLERTRKRVRQRWRSIEAAFIWHKEALESFDPDVVQTEPKEQKVKQKVLDRAERRYSSLTRGSALSFASLQSNQDDEADFKTLDQFKFILAKVSLGDLDTVSLFKRIDIDGDGHLTSMEFVKGMRVFAPSCVLEELRLRCVERKKSVWAAFSSLSSERKQAVLDRHHFHDVLDELDLSTNVNVDVIFDLVERVGNGIVIMDLIVALEAASLGTHMALPPALLEAKARQEVREQIAPFRELADDLRGDVRVVAHPARAASLPTGYSDDPGSYVSSSVVWLRDYARSHPSRKPAAASSVLLPSEVEAREESYHESNPVHAHSEIQTRRRSSSVPVWAVENKDTTLRWLRSASPDPFREAGQDYTEVIEEYFDNAQKVLVADQHLLKPKMVTPLEQHRRMKAAAAACK